MTAAAESAALPATGAFESAPSSPSAVDVSDHELMIAVRAGELDRLGELFERHHRPLFGYFVRVTGQRTLSEDLVQVVFHRILKYRHTYRDEGRFSAWIYHLARKVLADHWKKHAASAALHLRPGDLTDAPDGHPDSALTDPLHRLADHAPAPAERAAQTDDLAHLQAALAQLDPGAREVLVLHRFQQLRHDEIARLLDCSVGAAKVRAHRALTALRDVFFKLRREKHPA